MISASYFPSFRVLFEVLLEDFDSGEAGELVTVKAIPRRSVVENNHHREADTAEIELDLRDFPFDPRIVRSIRVFVFFGDLETPDEKMPTIRRFLRFAGFVDEPSTSLSEGGELVSFRCRDFTSLFLDKAWPGRAIPLSRPFPLVIRDVVAEVIPIGDFGIYLDDGTKILGPETGGLRVIVPSGTTGIILADIVGRKRFAVEEGDDAWTVLSDVCAVLGLLPTFELDELVIRSAGDFRRTAAVLDYGSNVERLTYKRKISELRAAQILVRSWDEKARARREALWPEEPVIVKRRVDAKGKVSREAAPRIPFYVSGSYSSAQLREIARSIYEEYARQEVEGEITTRDLTDLEGLADLTRLRNGDELRVRLGRAQEADVAALYKALPVREEAIRLLTEGYDRMSEEVAAAVVDATRKAENLASSFYVKSARHSMDRDQGYTLDVRFTNYLGKGAK